MSAKPAKKTNGAQSYGAETIKVLKGLDAVRKRPGMYIGDTDDGSGLHHMVYEVVDNAIDEALAGFASEVSVTLNPDGSCTVRDNGRGIPTDIHPEEGISAAEVVMTQLHAGGKFGEGEDDNPYKVSGGLHGVGVSVVNALSNVLELKIWRDGREHFVRFRNGVTEAPLKVDRRGRRQAGHRGDLLAEPPRLSTTSPNSTTSRLSIACASSPFSIPACAWCSPTSAMPTRSARRCATTAASASSCAISIAPRLPLVEAPIMLDAATRTASASSCALWWNDAYHEQVLCFTNNIPQRDGGTHLAGFRAALTRVINKYADETGIAKKEKMRSYRRRCA